MVDFFVDCIFVGLTELRFWKCISVDSLFPALVNDLIVSFPDLDITLTSFVFEPDGGFKEYSKGVLLLWDSVGGCSSELFRERMLQHQLDGLYEMKR